MNLLRLPILAALAIALVFAFGNRPSEVNSKGEATYNTTWVTDEGADPLTHPTCDAVSGFTEDGTAVFRSHKMVSPGRLSAQITNGLTPPMLIAQMASTGRGFGLVRNHDGNWISSGHYGGPVIPRLIYPVSNGGIAVIDADTILVSYTGKDPDYTGPDSRNMEAPFIVMKIGLTWSADGTLSGYENLGEVEVAAPVAVIALTKNLQSAYLVNLNSEYQKLNVNTMTVGTSVSLPALVRVEADDPHYGSGFPPANQFHADLSPDDRYLVANRWGEASVAVAELATDRTFNLVLQAGASRSGGVAFNPGRLWSTSDNFVLAVNERTQATAYSFSAVGLDPIATHALDPIDINLDGGPALADGWDPRGAHLTLPEIRGEADFGMYSLADATLGFNSALEACDAGNYPSDVLNPRIRWGGGGGVGRAPLYLPYVAKYHRFDNAVFLPVVMAETCISEEKHADVVFVVDSSYSMEEPTADLTQPKIQAAFRAIWRFLELDDELDQAGVITFDEEVRTLYPLQPNLVIPSPLEVWMGPQTRMEEGIKAAHEELMCSRRRPGNYPVIIFLSDGEPIPNPIEFAISAADEARRDGIRVYTVGVGHDIMPDGLRAIADNPSMYYHAPNGTDLVDIYEQIALDIPCPPGLFWGNRALGGVQTSKEASTASSMEVIINNGGLAPVELIDMDASPSQQ